MQFSVPSAWQADRAVESSAGSGDVARPANYARSVFHFSAALAGLVSVALLSRAWLLVIAVSFAGYCWSMEIARRVSPAINDRLMRFYGPIARASERYRVNSATWYATALVALALFGTRPAMMAALAVLGVADPIAAHVGRRWGRHTLHAGRSLEGTLAFLASGTMATVIALAVIGEAGVLRVLLFAGLAGLTGAIAELLSSRLDDNLTIPVTVGAVITAAMSVLSP